LADDYGVEPQVEAESDSIHRIFREEFAMHDAVPLACLAAGSSGFVDQVVGCASQVHRLRELGLHDGARIEVMQAGKPCIIRLNGHKLCFRDSDSMSVLIRPEVAKRARAAMPAMENAAALLAVEIGR
jgi:Fe2+ transport system protein FeoA